MINGVALGFANVIPAGPVGIVSAAGTGLQEVSTLLAKRGVGITQGIGSGGRDLSKDVGGIMMLAGLKALQEDPATQVIVLVSKPPAAEVAERVSSSRFAKRQADGGLPAGRQAVSELGAAAKHIYPVSTLEEARYQAAALASPGSVSGNRLRWSVWIRRAAQAPQAGAALPARPVLRRDAVLRGAGDLARPARYSRSSPMLRWRRNNSCPIRPAARGIPPSTWARRSSPSAGCTR